MTTIKVLPDGRVLHDAPNTFVITGVWMVVSVDDDGQEGVVAAPHWEGGPVMPLIAADEARLPMIKTLAKQIAGLTKKQLRLIRLDTRTDLETITP